MTAAGTHVALRSFCALTVSVALVALAAPPVGGVGLDGPAEANGRLHLGFGTGIDRVSGYGQDTYPFTELGAAAEAVVWRRMSVGGAFSLRWDLNDYNDALGRWRGHTGASVAAQLFVGYDGPRFHISAGPWMYGSGRQRPELRLAVLPYGVVRVRIGHLDHWHFTLRVGDGAPFTADGGAFGVRMLVGAPVSGHHRPAAGAYTTIGEKTAGLAVTDEIAGVGPHNSALRVGGLLGTDLEKPTTRPELTLFAALAW